jgi:hypothetical protein
MNSEFQFRRAVRTVFQDRLILRIRFSLNDQLTYYFPTHIIMCTQYKNKDLKKTVERVQLGNDFHNQFSSSL